MNETPRRPEDDGSIDAQASGPFRGSAEPAHPGADQRQGTSADDRDGSVHTDGAAGGGPTGDVAAPTADTERLEGTGSLGGAARPAPHEHSRPQPPAAVPFTAPGAQGPSDGRGAGAPTGGPSHESPAGTRPYDSPSGTRPYGTDGGRQDAGRDPAQPYAHRPQGAPYGAPQPGYGAAPQQQPPFAAASGYGRDHQRTDSFGRPVGVGAYVPPAGPGAPDAPRSENHGEPKRRRGSAALVAALAIGALVGGAAGGGVTAAVLGTSNSTSIAPTAADNGSITINDRDDVNAITAVAANASPSVVTIAVNGGQAAGTGSGVIISEDGYVITNTHVVTLDGAIAEPQIQVTADDGTIYSATIVGTDPVYDLAVIKLDDATGLTPIEFADSDDLNVGDTAIAIGAPLGLAGTVTNGIVSALNRSITVASSAAPDDGSESAPDGGDGSSPFDFWNFDIPGQDESQQPQATSSISLSVIQTDAAINPGNSGGALLDAEGRLIGVNVAIASAGGSSSEQSGNIGVGFSIPSNIAKRVSDEIIATGSATHGLLGASVTDAASSGESDVAGALISQVTSGGSAEAAGLRAGDVVTAFDGVPVTSSTDLTAQVRALAGGASATITFVRDGQNREADVTLGTLTR